MPQPTLSPTPTLRTEHHPPERARTRTRARTRRAPLRVGVLVLVPLLCVLLVACEKDPGAEEDVTSQLPPTSITPEPTAPATPNIEPALLAITWGATLIDGVTPPEGARITLALGVNGGGSLDCNSYTATISMGPGDAFHAEVGAMTAAGCFPSTSTFEAWFDVVDRYLSTLRSTTTYQISPDELILRTADQRELRFTPSTLPTQP